MASVHDVVESVVRLCGLDLEEIKQVKAGSRILLRITIDGDGSAGKGLCLDEVAEVSGKISQALDDGDVMGQTAYVLEVGTPGVDRPLTKPAHFRRNAGRLVKIRTKEDESVLARILSSDEESVHLSNERRIEFAQIAKAVVQVEMKRDGDDGLGDED